LKVVTSLFRALSHILLVCSWGQVTSRIRSRAVNAASRNQTSAMATVGDVLHDYIFSGGINKGGTWGGMDCFLHIPLEVHRTELVLWFALLAAAFVGLKLYDHVQHLHRVAAFVVAGYVQSPTERALDVAFAVVHFGNWLLVLYYKIHLHSLVNLLQPCHLLLFLQGLGVLSNGPWTALLGALTFPWVVGAVMGLVVPATEGLDQPFEYEQVGSLTHTRVYLMCGFHLSSRFSMLTTPPPSHCFFPMRAVFCPALAHGRDRFAPADAQQPRGVPTHVGQDPRYVLCSFVEGLFARALLTVAIVALLHLCVHVCSAG